MNNEGIEVIENLDEELNEIYKAVSSLSKNVPSYQLGWYITEHIDGQLVVTPISE